MSLAKYLARAKALGKEAGSVGLGLGALGAAKGVELAHEHPQAAKMLGAGAGGAALAALFAGKRPSAQEMEEEEMQRMREKYEGTPYQKDVLGY